MVIGVAYLLPAGTIGTTAVLQLVPRKSLILLTGTTGTTGMTYSIIGREENREKACKSNLIAYSVLWLRLHFHLALRKITPFWSFQSVGITISTSYVERQPSDMPFRSFQSPCQRLSRLPLLNRTEKPFLLYRPLQKSSANVLAGDIGIANILRHHLHRFMPPPCILKIVALD